MYIKAQTIVPHATDKQPAMDAILVGTGGNLNCRLSGDSADIILYGLQTGKIYPIQLDYIYVVSTTASDMTSLVAGRIAH